VANPLLAAGGGLSRHAFGAAGRAPSMSRGSAALAAYGQSPAAGPRAVRAAFAPEPRGVAAPLPRAGAVDEAGHAPAPDDTHIQQRALTRLASRFDAEALASAADVAAPTGAPSVMDERGRRAFAIMHQVPLLLRASPRRSPARRQSQRGHSERELPDVHGGGQSERALPDVNTGEHAEPDGEA